MKRRALTAALVAALAFSAAAFAATVPLGTRTVGNGAAAVPACDTDGFTIAYTTSRGSVTSVTIGGIQQPACTGGSLSVDLVDSGGASIGSGGPLTVTSATSLAVTITGAPAAGSVARFGATITGP